MLELSSPRSMNKKEPKLYFMERVGTCSGTCVQEGILLVQLEFEGSLARSYTKKIPTREVCSKAQMC